METDRIRIVDSNVGDHPATCCRVVDAPALQMRREVHSVEHADRKHVSDAACPDRIPDRQM